MYAMHTHNVRPLNVFKDSLFNAQLQRFVGHTGAGGADIGECYAAASTIREGDGESWYSGWHGLAERIESHAEASLALGHTASARSGLLKASNYYHAAYMFMMQPEPDSRLVAAYRAQRRAFEKVTDLFPEWGRRIEIPFEQRHLHGYFFSSPSPGPRPVLIVTNGYDSTAEEAYFFSGAAALARGYHVVTYDGPGQGADADRERPGISARLGDSAACGDDMGTAAAECGFGQDCAAWHQLRRISWAASRIRRGRTRGNHRRPRTAEPAGGVPHPGAEVHRTPRAERQQVSASGFWIG